MPFQTTVYGRPAPAVAGDFASDNPRTIYVAGPGGLVAGASGVTIGRFAWVSNSSEDWDGGPSIANNFGAGSVAGLVHRRQQGLITTYLAESGTTVPKGYPIDLLTSGDVWLKNEGTTEAVYGMKAYANYSTGAVTFAATSSPTAGGSGDASTIAAGTASVTGSITDNTLTVTAVSSGTLYPGAVISGTDVVSGTQIVSQVSGTTGGVGVYKVSIGEQTVASTTISETYGLLTIGGTVTAGFAVGQLLSGSGITGTYITALGTGTGGAGTYIVNKTQSVSSQTIGSYVNVETKWFAISSGLAGEVVKCSTQTLG